MKTSDTIVQLFKTRGDSEYGGEAVTQLEHALQCAALAAEVNEKPSLIVAALLHDIGHLLHDLPDDAPEQGVDDHHENSGNRFLQLHFNADVCEPVKLHVAAKRYLCAVDSEYEPRLSRPSLISLQLQGGRMSAEEVHAFEGNPYYRDAVTLRKWDDQGKIQNLEVPGIESYVPLIEQLANEKLQAANT